MEGTDQKIPDLSFSVSVETASEVLNEAVEDVGVVGESVNFIVDKGLFTVSSEGDLSNANIVIKESDKFSVTIDATEKEFKNLRIGYNPPHIYCKQTQLISTLH